MAYTINLTDGSVFATIADGTINTSSSMTLVGKNYAGYGEFLDENFMRLLQNAASPASGGGNPQYIGAPITGQLWWDSTNSLMKAYNGTTWKVISGATTSTTAPSSVVAGDLWYDSVNGQLKVYSGSAWILVGPASSSGQGTSGAIVDTVTDTFAADHVVVKLYVENVVVGIVSKDSSFTPQTPITGFANVNPGIQLSSTVTDALFYGTALDSQTLDGIDSTGFLSATSNDTTTGTLGILNDAGLSVGADSDARISVSGSDVYIRNQTQNGNLIFQVNDGGVTTTAMTVYGANGTVSGTQITAQYADVAERFAADEELEAGTVVELGGDKEITKVKGDLSENVFGVVSTRAAYLMNSAAGNDSTHPPVAMTGRVPVKVVGAVKKGDRLVSAGNGIARAALPGEATAFNVIGRALEAKHDVAEGFVEAIVATK